GDGDQPDAPASSHDEEVEVAAAVQVEVRDAPRQRHHADERQRAHDLEQPAVILEKRAALRLAPAAFRDEIVPAAGKEKAVAAFDRYLQRRTRRVRDTDILGGLFRLDQRVPQLFQGHRIVEQRRVRHGTSDGGFPVRHDSPRTTARLLAVDPSASAHPTVSTTSVHNVAHAAPSMDIVGTSRTFNATLASSAVPQIAAYAH